MALEVGNKAPSFNLKNQHDKPVKLSDYKGKKLLIYFYPRASTPGCTVQSCSVGENLTALRKAGVEAIGVSPDKPAAQLKFDLAYKLGFPLLCDTEHTMAEAYSVWVEKNMYGNKSMGILRSAFLVDEAGKLLGVWYKVKPEDTVPNVKTLLSIK